MKELVELIDSNVSSEGRRSAGIRKFLPYRISAGEAPRAEWGVVRKPSNTH